MRPMHKAALACSFALACNAALAFELSSTGFEADGPIASKYVYKGFGCEGDNVSPALSWKDPPQGTRSFALMAHDPDAPSGGAGWWHWIVYDLSASVRSLPEGAGTAGGNGLPAGAVQQKNDFGTAAYGGPCPPAGDKPHHYIFTIYALKVDKLDVPKGATASLVGFAVNADAIGKATLTGMYGRAR